MATNWWLHPGEKQTGSLEFKQIHSKSKKPARQFLGI